MRYVITRDTALALMRNRTVIPERTGLLAPTLLRSQLLSALYVSVRKGEFGRAEARARLDHMRSLRIRLLGDRVLQKVAWDVATQLDWEDTLTAEYIALTKLQADALVTCGEAFEEQAGTIVRLATAADLLA